jgi:hypothetical protein
MVCGFGSWRALSYEDVPESLARSRWRKVARALEQSLSLREVVVGDRRRPRRSCLRGVEWPERRVDHLSGKEATIAVATVARSFEVPARLPKVVAPEIERRSLPVRAPGLKTTALARDTFVASRLAGARVSRQALLLQRLDAAARRRTGENRDENDETEQPGQDEDSGASALVREAYHPGRC